MIERQGSDETSTVLPPIPPPRGFGGWLLDGWNKANLILGGGVGLGVSILTATHLPGKAVDLWLLVFVGFLLLWCSLALLAAMTAGRNDVTKFHSLSIQERARYEQERLARARDKEFYEREAGRAVVVAAVKPYSPYERSQCVFIVRWPAISALPMGAPVIISTALPTHERPLGGGVVRPPQQDGKAVITLDSLHPDAEQFVKQLLEAPTNIDAVKQVRIGPGYNLQDLAPAPNGPPALASTTLTQPEAVAPEAAVGRPSR